jgi:hypothetical protein
MTNRKTRSWLATLVLPMLVAGPMVGCDDDEDPPKADAGTGGTGGATGGTGGGTGGTGGGTGGTGGGTGGTGGTGGGADAGDTPPAGCADPTIVDTDIAASATWSCPKYLLKKKIYVTGNSTLTIMPGVTVLGDPASSDKSALIVTRGSKLMAKGTKAMPIVFTSGNPVGSRVSGDWAGVALVGSASINLPGGQGNLEGLPTTEAKGFYGGTDDASSCGELEYVRIEFAGAVFTEGRELNALTLAGCGSGTKVSYVQVHRGKDDGVEFFGGTASVDHVVITGMEDDGLDWDLGWRGTAQYVIIHHYSHPDANHGIEASNNTMQEVATPRSDPKVSNLTMISEGSAKSIAINFKEGTRGKIRNSIIQGYKVDVVDFVATTNPLAMEWPMYLSIDYTFFWDNGPYKNDDMLDMAFPDQTSVEDPARNNKKDVNPMFTGTFSADTTSYVPGNTALDGLPAPGFGDAAGTFAGAVKPGDTAPWYMGWAAFPKN